MDSIGQSSRGFQSKSPLSAADPNPLRKRKDSPLSETSSEPKRSRKDRSLSSPQNQASDSNRRPISNTSSPEEQAAEALASSRAASKSPLDKEARKHKHRRREAEVETRDEEGSAVSPSRKRHREKSSHAEGSGREAGEIPDIRRKEKERDRERRHHSQDRHRSTSRPRARESAGHDKGPSRDDGPSSKARDGRHDLSSQARSLASTRLVGIPEDLRQAALAAQKRRQEAEAAAEREREAEAAAAQKAKQAVIDAINIVSEENGADKPSKHSPIVWNGAGETGPDQPLKTAKPLSIAERAKEELAAFQGLQSLGIDPAAPAAIKASPSHSGSEAGEAQEHPMDGDAAHIEPAAAIKSRWLLDEDEGLPSSNGQANGEEEARIAALNKEEQQDLDITREMEEQEREWDEDEDISDFQRTRPPVNMLNSSRRVECFERLNRISEGTYGVVHRARDKETNTICALKKIKMEKEKDGFPLTSIREINILLCFHHKNIVDVSEVAVGSSLDDVFMVMEFMEHDLKGLMEDMAEPFTVAEAKNLMRQLLEGIAYLHSNWVLHRDLKTSNILYNNKGQLKICDFGLARQFGSPLRPYTHNVVTLYYRSIELLLGAKEYSTAIDIWSLGCIMAELLTKKVLFEGTSEIDQIDKIFKILGSPNEKVWPGYKNLDGVKKLKLREQRRTMREVLPAASRFDPNSGLTEAGFDLIERMLAVDPRQRITAEQALNHEWFKEQPKAKENYLMPTYPTSKDGSSRTARQRLSKPASPVQAGPNFGRVADSFKTIFGR